MNNDLQIFFSLTKPHRQKSFPNFGLTKHWLLQSPGGGNSKCKISTSLSLSFSLSFSLPPSIPPSSCLSALHVFNILCEYITKILPNLLDTIQKKLFHQTTISTYTQILVIINIFPYILQCIFINKKTTLKHIINMRLSHFWSLFWQKQLRDYES